MRTIIVVIMMSLVLVTAAQALDPVRTLPTDGNGNVPPLVWTGTDWALDTSVRKIDGAIVFDTIAASCVSTEILTDTTLDATFDTFAFGSTYNWYQVTVADTDILVSLTYAEAAAGKGDYQPAKTLYLYPFRVPTLWIQTRSGLACSGDYIAVRGMR